MTGAALYQKLTTDPGTDGDWQDPDVAYPGWRGLRDDTDGLWYSPSCYPPNWTGAPAEGQAYFKRYFAAHNAVYVPTGQAVPQDFTVDPQVLVRAAMDSMTVPRPEFDRNPKALGDGSTLVNLPTWFWLENKVRTGTVTAAIPGASATVVATLDDASFSNPNAGSVTCAGTGVVWTSGATSSCFLQMPRATAAATVTARTSWGVTWTYNGPFGARVGALDPVTGLAADTFPVREVQAIVTGAGA